MKTSYPYLRRGTIRIKLRERWTEECQSIALEEWKAHVKMNLDASASEEKIKHGEKTMSIRMIFRMFENQLKKGEHQRDMEL